MKYIKHFFIFLVIIALGYFTYGELIVQGDTPEVKSLCQEFNDGWVVVNEDGSREKMELPGNYKGALIMENKLPDTLDRTITSICFRGTAMKVYIGDQLRSDYNTDSTRLFGSHSAEVYNLVFINADDAGKTIRVEMENDVGIMYSIYLGDRMGIWKYLFEHYGSELMIAFLTLILGVISILASMAIKFFYKKSVDLEYLGWGVFFAAIWLITNSVFRQVLFPGVSAISDMPFLMISIMPFPFMIYMNQVQNNRYEIIYTCSGIVDVLGAIICIGLHVTNIADFTKSFLLLAICCLQSILLLAITVLLDIKCGKVREYWMVAVGLLSTFVAATYQIISYFRRTGVFSGVPLAVGLIVLLVFSVVNTLKNIILLENQKYEAVMASEAKGRFLANMSHEIRTPINAVLGMNEMVLRESTESNIREYAMDIRMAGQNLLSIINDILDFSKIESGKMELVMVDYDFSSVIHDIMNIIRVKAETKDLYFDLHIDSNLPARMHGDDVRIRQVLINLLNNAVKYTEKGGVTFSVTGKTQGDIANIRFEVKDTGIGIKEEELASLFAEFERIDSERNRHIEGTGLGMSITRQLLELMGSKLSVDSVYGKGSTFSFELTQKITDSEPIGNLEKRMKEQAKKFSYEVSFKAPSAHILIVDDNAVNRKVVMNLLKDTQIRIDEASGGIRCLEMVAAKEYDLILLDHMMPDLDGVQTLHSLKELEHNLSILAPVIAMTANAVSGAKEMYLAEGFDDFITKPVAPEKLEAMLVKHLPKDKVMEVESVEDVEPQSVEKGDFQGILSAIAANPEFNLEYAKTFSPDPEDLIEVFHDFYEIAEEEAALLQQFYEAISNGDSEEALRQYRVQVHSMKSSAAMIGAMGLNGMALALEKAAANKNITVMKAITPIFLNEWLRYKELTKNPG